MPCARLRTHGSSCDMSMQYPQHSEPEDPTDDSVETSEAISPVAEPVSTEETRQRTDPTGWPWLLDIYMAALLVTIFAVDQATKGWVRGNVFPGDSIPTDGLFRITHTFNTGGAFGILPNQTTLLMLASIVGIGILLLFLRNAGIPGIWLRTSLGLQLGGAAGNLVDRITLGKVTDFIDIGAWPVFNLADSSIVVGLVILAWFLMRTPKETRKAAHEVEELPSEAGLEPHPMPSSDGSDAEEHR